MPLNEVDKPLRTVNEYDLARVGWQELPMGQENDITRLYRVFHSGNHPETHGVYRYLITRGGTDPADPAAIFLELNFQYGNPLTEGVNGALTIQLLKILEHHLQAFLGGKFQNQYTERAVTYLQAAIGALEERARDRIERGVLGEQKQ